MSDREEAFCQAVRGLLARGRYPDVAVIREAMGRPGFSRSGLSPDETAWRAREVQAAGYDWERSKKAKKLIKPDS